MKRPYILRLLLLFSLFLVGLLGFGGMPVGAQTLPTSQSLQQQLNAIAPQLASSDDGRAQLAALQALGQSAAQAMNQHEGDLAELEQRLQGLGAAPAAGSAADAAPVAAQRRQLLRQQKLLHQEQQLLGLLQVQAQQRSADLLRQRHALFRAAVGARSASPLSPDFWRPVQAAASDDVQRLSALWQSVARSAGQAWAGQRAALWAHLALALLLASVLPWLARRALMHWLARITPATRLRALLLVVLSVSIDTLCAAFAVFELFGALGATGDLQASSVRAGAYAVFGASLGSLLLGQRQALWRPLPLSDAQAQQVGWLPQRLALLSGLVLWLGDIHSIAHLSRASEALLQAVFALSLGLALAQGLRCLSRSRPGAGDEAAPRPPRPFWLGLLLAGASALLLVALLALLTGYVTLAQMLTRQMVWVSVVGAMAYLLSILIDDLSAALLSSQGRWGARLSAQLGMQGRLFDQLAVVASAVLRLLLWFYVLVALLAPLGSSPDELWLRGQQLSEQLQIGDVTITPSALLTALLVALLGFVAIALLQRWLNQRYFPHTTLEPGLRHSIVTLLGYLGGVWVIALALAALGVSVERIAWVASALSVGIGFGLQAIVQNFISGLILLIERPIKVGDWVALGDTEGDVRRVNVRATEIVRSDRSTVLVPNSQFITQSVRNVTASGSPGSVSLRLPAPLDVDVLRMREVVLQCLHAHAQVLAEPAPSVSLEGVVDGTLLFAASCAVASPRQVYGVRSQLWFALLQALPAAGLRLAPPTRVTQQGEAAG